MAKDEHITGSDPASTGGAAPLSDQEQQEHVAGDLGVTEAELRQGTGETEEPSGGADWGHALAPPG